MLYHPDRMLPELFRHCIVEIVRDQLRPSRKILGCANELFFEGSDLVYGRLKGFNLPSP